MAIEFDCPYCTATIRVPDAYGGKQGRCPKCDTRLLVPMVVRPGATTVPEASASPVTASSPDPLAEIAVPAELFPVKPVNTPGRRRRGTRRRPSRALVVGMPVLCFLVLLAVIFFSVTGSLPELTGELVTTRLEENTLPGVTIPWSDTGLSSEEQQTLQTFLATTPETLASDVMTCRMIGTESGIEVRLTAGAGSSWFVVDTTGHKPLALWLKKERSVLNTKRISLLHASLAAYAKEKLAQIAGEPLVIDALSVRENVAINACGGALSFVVHGVAGNRLVPCAYEDDMGKLYFCLPRDTQTFQIPGRTFSDGTKPFGGEFTAVVSGLSRPAAEQSESQSTTGAQDGDPASDTMMPDTDSGSMKNENSEGASESEMSEQMSAEEMTDGDMKSESMNGGNMSDETPMNRSKMESGPGMQMDRGKSKPKGMFEEEDDEMSKEGMMMEGEMKPESVSP